MEGSGVEVQPTWNRIVNRMLPSGKHIGEYPEACKKLQKMNTLCERAGGMLISRQVMSLVLADFDL